jgi:hypothetical protein
VSVFETAVGDAGLEHLAALPMLETVLTGRSKVTPEGQSALRARRPGINLEEPT